MQIDPKTVEKLEDKIEQAIAEVVVGIGLKRLAIPPYVSDYGESGCVGVEGSGGELPA